MRGAGLVPSEDAGEGQGNESVRGHKPLGVRACKPCDAAGVPVPGHRRLLRVRRVRVGSDRALRASRARVRPAHGDDPVPDAVAADVLVRPRGDQRVQPRGSLPRASLRRRPVQAEGVPNHGHHRPGEEQVLQHDETTGGKVRSLLRMVQQRDRGEQPASLHRFPRGARRVVRVRGVPVHRGGVR